VSAISLVAGYRTGQFDRKRSCNLIGAIKKSQVTNTKKITNDPNTKSQTIGA
jgi:hypothetical protein